MKKPKFAFTTTTSGTPVTAQSYTMGDEYDYDSPDSVHQFNLFDFADFKPNFNTIEVDKKFKILTDLIHCVPFSIHGPVVSERLLNLLQSFKLPPHRIYPVPIKHKGKLVENYSFIHLPHPPSIKKEFTTEEFELTCESEPTLTGVALINLCHPRHLAYCWMSQELLNAIIVEKVSGVHIPKTISA